MARTARHGASASESPMDCPSPRGGRPGRRSAPRAPPRARAKDSPRRASDRAAPEGSSLPVPPTRSRLARCGRPAPRRRPPVLAMASRKSPAREQCCGAWIPPCRPAPRRRRTPACCIREVPTKKLQSRWSLDLPLPELCASAPQRPTESGDVSPFDHSKPNARRDISKRAIDAVVASNAKKSAPRRSAAANLRLA